MPSPSFLTRLRGIVERAIRGAASETGLLLQGHIAAELLRARGPLASLQDAEFRVFSQFGDDGIVQCLVQQVAVPHRVFAEFGVSDYRESTTRFLLLNDRWSGFVMDGDPVNVQRIVHSEYATAHDLQARAAFITAENINGLLTEAKLPAELGLLHIDLDGNDYWVLKAITVVQPVILILEYNAVFGAERAITVPYDPAFQRTRAHHSNLYFGASLPALHALATERGYAFLGCNRAGNNAYFVRRDYLRTPLREVGLAEGFTDSQFTESRDVRGELTHARGAARLALIRGLPVVNVLTGATESL